jgi:hypothetical protein
MMRAIYVFEAFSLTLVVAGLFSEFFKPRSIDVSNLPANSTQDRWLDVVKATRARLAGTMKREEVLEDALKSGETAQLRMLIGPGDCRFYLVIAKPPAKISVSVDSQKTHFFAPLGTQPNLAWGSICNS